MKTFTNPGSNPQTTHRPEWGIAMEFLLALSRALLLALDADDPMMTHLCARSFLVMSDHYFPD